MIKILTVCTGNICRSPYAQLFLQSELDRVAPGSFMFHSAGSYALVGQQMDERSLMKLHDVGVASDGFVARQLNEDNVSGNDLILAMTDAHRNSVVAMSPRMLKRTYTVREFAAVLDEFTTKADGTLPEGNDTTTVEKRWVALLKAAPLARHSARMKVEKNLDIVDPYRQSNPVYDRMVDELLPALRSIVNFESHFGNMNK